MFFKFSRFAKVFSLLFFISFIESETNNADLVKKLDNVQQELNQLTKIINKTNKTDPKEHEHSKEHESAKLNTITNQTKKVISNVYTTLKYSYKLIMNNSDVQILLYNSFKDFLKIALISLTVGYLTYIGYVKLIQYYQNVYNHLWHTIALDFSFSIFYIFFLLSIYFSPQIGFSFISTSLENFEIAFMFSILNNIFLSILMLSIIKKLINYSSNKIILNIKQYITHTLLLIFITWSASNILKSFVAIYEINKMNSSVIYDISIIRDFFYTSILIHALITFRKKLKYKFQNKNIWIKHLTGIESVTLIILYTVMIFWINLDISYKLTRSVVSMILWPFLVASSIFLRKYIINYIRKLNFNYRSHLKSIHTRALKAIKVSAAPIAIIMTLKIWGISIYKNLAIIFGAPILNKLLSLFYLLLFSFIILWFVKHFLTNWMINKTKENKDEKRKFEILFKIFQSGSKSIINFSVFLTSLSIFGYNTSQIIPALGFLSAGLSVSVRDIITDLLNGLFIIMENTIMVGDLIVIDGKNAKVEDMTLRYMQVRQDNGTLITIPFHKVNEVFNKSRNFMGVLMNVAVTYNTDSNESIKAFEDAFDILRSRQEFMHKVFLPLEMRGLSEVNGLYYTIHARIKVMPGYQFKIQRELNKIIKDLFDKRGIKMPTDITLGHLHKSPSTVTSLPESLT